MTQHPKEPREPDHWMYADTAAAAYDVVELVARAICREQMPYRGARQPLLDESVEEFWPDYRDAARAAIAATPPRIPEGFVLVPKLPTETMLEASWQATRVISPEDRMRAELMSPAASHKHKARDRYRAMIAAAPQAPALPETGVE